MNRPWIQKATSNDTFWDSILGKASYLVPTIGATIYTIPEELAPTPFGAKREGVEARFTFASSDRAKLVF